MELTGGSRRTVRFDSFADSMNEAVALDLLAEAGLASQQAASVSFTVNGGEPTLRLMIEHPDDDAWQDVTFQSDGALYKAESTGGRTVDGDRATVRCDGGVDDRQPETAPAAVPRS